MLADYIGEITNIAVKGDHRIKRICTPSGRSFITDSIFQLSCLLIYMLLHLREPHTLVFNSLRSRTP